MPFGDRTEPRGLGPMTGRAMGYCGGYPGPGYMNPSPGFGFSRLPISMFLIKNYPSKRTEKIEINASFERRGKNENCAICFEF